MKREEWLVVLGFASTVFALGAGWAHFSDRMDKQEAVIAEMKKAPPPTLTYKETACIDILKNLNEAYRSDNSIAAIHFEGLAKNYGCDTGAQPVTTDPDSKHGSS
jgi:hypothetical protein